MNPLLRGSAAHVFVDSLDVPELDDADAHHLARVLRLTPGDLVSMSDGRGSWAPARLGGAGMLERTGEVVAGPQARGLTIVCAIAKGERTDLAVQKLTEIGVDRITLFEASRSVVHWDAGRRTKQLDRLRRIAREAAMQSRRVHLPEVGIADFAAVAGTTGLAVAEPDARERIDRSVLAVAVGPEGGFTPDEVAQVGRSVRLTDTILRVETAAIVAAAALVAAHE